MRRCRHWWRRREEWWSQTRGKTIFACRKCRHQWAAERRTKGLP